MLDKKRIFKELRDYFMVLAGTLIYSAGVVLFMLPYELTTGGVAGISALVFYATGIQVPITYALVNIIFLIFGARIIGLNFCIKSIFGFGSITFWLSLLQPLLENPVTHQVPQLLGSEMFMACVISGILEGLGLSICFYNNGSTGGTDIIAAIVHKYKDISLGQILMVCDILIVGSSYFIFHDVQKVIFGFILLIVAAMTLDYFTRKFCQVVEFKVFSRNYSAIADRISKEGFGVTVLSGEGWYTKSERNVVMCVCSKRYAETIMRAIQTVDPFCFVSVTNAVGVYGEGFGNMKTKVKDQKPIIVFATNNENKLSEVRSILGNRFEVRSLKEVGCTAELPETHSTLEENAMEKARYVKQYYGFDCFADDTGLEVDALGGEPGVYSARYANIPDEEYSDPLAGEDHDSEANMRKLLHKLEGKEDRTARFRTSIALIYQGSEYLFDGIVNGSILTEKQGTEGFGYDPVFMPEGYDKSFAELGADIKNKISHRALATEKLAGFLLGK
ncbi:MAG: non-canonical purine NTP diphosphatase [Clostridium sp.]|nr:non-canonical purine NTP diphosphatase [Clostridium sp.]